MEQGRQDRETMCFSSKGRSGPTHLGVLNPIGETTKQARNRCRVRLERIVFEARKSENLHQPSIAECELRRSYTHDEFFCSRVHAACLSWASPQTEKFGRSQQRLLVERPRPSSEAWKSRTRSVASREVSLRVSARIQYTQGWEE
ncbi:hypothetical protein CC1G_15635 [Coprinopsis cinerea okayama7|uniref:Uncharacterized protein n=1 Tax=Coprinopsis cinerea (strain Okayama-7 / 130 / ATCC MYA-4618 / FGSC 9003) TaxID=240176 RepID=D6RN86_COPC7|nr:hypothetical protein CC1G_15635 [Coprinopsis cinerea okayama7\|eukprot:XP_002911093.1 hypothetical protein CC1G_15635 [Coprinopsis cinerea okayama7\